jgi:hypothetical protein
MITKVKQIQKQIEALLKDPTFRDDDRVLVANFWYGQLIDSKIDPKKISAHELLHIYVNGGLANSDLITRARRKAQEENPELRGKTWIERHKKADDFRKNI